MQRPCLSLRAPKAPPRPLAVVVREHPETQGGHGVGGMIRRRRRRGGTAARGPAPAARGRGGATYTATCIGAAVCCWAWGAVLLDRVDLRHAVGNAAWG